MMADNNPVSEPVNETDCFSAGAIVRTLTLTLLVVAPLLRVTLLNIDGSSVARWLEIAHRMGGTRFRQRQPRLCRLL